MSKLSFKLQVFEGPLDLLMHLIQKNKVNIYDIPISHITEQYLEYLDSMQEMDLEVSSEFLVMAATLLYIKSKMLLPKYEDPEEEEIDPRQELVDKLLEYKKYKDSTRYFYEQELKAQSIFYKVPEIISFEEVKPNLINISVDELIIAFQNLLKRKHRKAPPPRQSFEGIVGRERVSVGDKVRDILHMLAKHERLRFIDIFHGRKSRPEIVALFLAILEMIKLKRILVEQEKKEIYIYKLEDGDLDGDQGVGRDGDQGD